MSGTQSYVYNIEYKLLIYPNTIGTMQLKICGNSIFKNPTMEYVTVVCTHVKLPSSISTGS